MDIDEINEYFLKENSLFMTDAQMGLATRYYVCGQSLLGKKRSDEARAVMSLRQKERFEINPVSIETKTKQSKAHKGVPLSKKHATAIGVSNIGKKITSEQSKARSLRQTGKKATIEAKAAIKIARNKLIICPYCNKENKSIHVSSCKMNPNVGPRKTGYTYKQETSICPWCNKEGGLSMMTRTHFDNCKQKPGADLEAIRLKRQCTEEDKKKKSESNKKPKKKTACPKCGVVATRAHHNRCKVSL